jgi:excisionase family DNA binding protein
MSERWLSKKEAAALSGYSEKTIQRAIRRGLLRCADNGVRRVRIAYSQFERWMNGAKVRA